MTRAIETGSGLGSSADADTHRATAWAVLGSSGQYSDWMQWVVAVYADEQAAKDAVGALTSAMRSLFASKPDVDWDDYEASMPLQDEWAAEIKRLDPGADEYDDPHYTAVEAPFFATGEA